ncbi:MAG TPA: GNAT family N-acetyltransferase [Myxococcota bacterium]|nr:GNAT family N-acetyltransferase [Myxococcota bacterium]
MPIRPFRAEDAAALAALSRSCARGETDFVLNPLWETERDLFAEFERHGVEPEEHLLVADPGDGRVEGCVGFVRRPRASTAGLVCPIVAREARGQGVGGELLRAGLAHGGDLGVKLVSAAIGVRNRAGYSLLSAFGFRPTRQHFLMRLDAKPARTALGRVAGGRGSGEELVLAAAKPADAEAILALYRACGFEPRSDESMRAVLEDGRHAHAVAREGGRIVAFAEIETHWPERPWVAFVGVEAALRDRGVGSALVGWSLARLFDAGAQSALLLLSPGNRTALRAYEKVGFRRHRLVDVLEKGL